MKKYLVALVAMSALYGNCNAMTFEELGNQVFEQTKITIHKKGGPAAFYDYSEGKDTAVKAGVVSHVLTNRFVQADLGWYSGKTGVIVGGPSIVLTDAFAYFMPDTSKLVTDFIPDVLQGFYLGTNIGWGTDNGAPHYGVHFGYNLGGN